MWRTAEKLSSGLSALAPVSSAKADHDYFMCFLKSKTDIVSNLATPLKTASILVVGSGYFYPDVIFYSACAGNVVGIDVKGCFWRDGFFKTGLTSLKRRKGGKKIVLAAIDTFKSRFLIRKNYYGQLERHLGRRVEHAKLDLISYDGKDIPFNDNTFDAVISNAVLEHVKDLPGIIKEMARVTKKSGVNYHLYHNYYSFSGNHKPHGLNKMHPWGHLRGLIRTNPEHLNRVQILDLENIFLSHFNEVKVFPIDRNHNKRGIDDEFRWEEEALFQSYRDDLERRFAKEMLLSRGYLVVGKKRVVVEPKGKTKL